MTLFDTVTRETNTISFTSSSTLWSIVLNAFCGLIRTKSIQETIVCYKKDQFWKISYDVISVYQFSENIK